MPHPAKPLLTSARETGKRLAKRAGFVIQRWPATRFDAMDDALLLLHRAGFRPDAVIDLGANRGQWTQIARRVFTNVPYHLVEPQPGCAPSLQELARINPDIHVYATVVTHPGVVSVRMVGGGDTQDSTGNFIPPAGEAAEKAVSYPATTVDALFGSVQGTHLLLKLDVEGHELAVLDGARRTLDRVEVIVSEFWTYRMWNNAAAITFTDLLLWLRDAGYVLYDFAALAARRRDQRLRNGDAIFVRRDSPLLSDASWD